MKRIVFFFLSALLAASPVDAAGKLNVVATTAFNADLARKVGGELVDVKSVAPPKFNVHFIQPKPSDVKNVARADVYITSGLDLEAWADPLAEAAGKPRLFRGGLGRVELSEGVSLLKAPQGALSRSQGDIHLFGNPHYHLNPENAKLMARNLAARFGAIDPENAPLYEANAARFVSELDGRIASWRSMCAACAGKEVYAYHDDVAYLADFLGLKADRFLEPKPGIPPVPRHLRDLEEYAVRNSVKAVLQASYFPRAISEELARKIGARVVIIAQGVGEVPEASDVFSLYQFNVKQIAEALK
jgi:zinc/manganese transport system substrate-binding protein